MNGKATRALSGKLFAGEKEVLFAFFSSRLLIWVFAWGALRWFKPGHTPFRARPALWDLLYRWDAVWYAAIAKHGYTYAAGEPSTVSFFPILPLLVALVRRVTTARLELAGFLVSNLALLAAAIFFRRLVALDYPRPSRVGERATWLLLFCPMTFFHSGMYTESLFLLFTIAAVLMARQGDWARAGLAGALATGTRGNGILILLPLLCEAMSNSASAETQPADRKSLLRSRWWLLIVPAGLLGYMALLRFKFGDAFAFLRSQAVFGRHAAPPWIGVGAALTYPIVYGRFLIATVCIAPLLCLLGFWMRLRFSYQIYAGAFVVACLCTTLLDSLPRYLSVVFPFYIALAAAGERREGFFLLSFAASGALMALCLALYVCGYRMF